jgi:hypothetical protein
LLNNWKSKFSHQTWDYPQTNASYGFSGITLKTTLFWTGVIHSQPGLSLDLIGASLGRSSADRQGHQKFPNPLFLVPDFRIFIGIKKLRL